MIEYARSFVAAERPIDYHSVFISYSSHDEALAERLYADLQARGVRCWYAPHDLEIGEPILSGIDRGIRLHDKLLLILSAAAGESAWIEQEVEMALARERTERRRVLFPIRIDDAVSAQTGAGLRSCGVSGMWATSGSGKTMTLTNRHLHDCSEI